MTKRLDELSAKTLKSYIKKAKPDYETQWDSLVSKMNTRANFPGKSRQEKQEMDVQYNKNNRKYNNRAKGLELARNKSSVRVGHSVKEDVEPLDEQTTKKRDTVKAQKELSRLKQNGNGNGVRAKYLKSYLNRMANEEFEPLDEKAKYKYVSGFKPSNSGVALKKGAVDMKKQAGTYGKWKKIKDEQGKDAADTWLQRHEDYESIEELITEMQETEEYMKNLNEDETQPDAFQASREVYDALIQSALAGNPLDVKDAVNDIMIAKASEVVDAVKNEVAATMFGTEEPDDEDGRPKGDDDDEYDEEGDEDDDEEGVGEDEEETEDDESEDDETEGYDEDDLNLPDDEEDDPEETEEA